MKLSSLELRNVGSEISSSGSRAVGLSLRARDSGLQASVVVASRQRAVSMVVIQAVGLP